MVTAQQVKELRDRTGISMMACKKALEVSDGNIEKALEVLREEGAKVADKKSSRDLNAGTINAYVHATKQIGVMVEVRSETDFVAKHGDFQTFAYDVAMHIAAMDPVCISEDGLEEGSENTKEDTLLGQTYIKDPSKTVDGHLKEMIQKFGENIEITRFVRYAV